MDGDWGTAILWFLAGLAATGLSLVFGLWLAGAVIWGKPGWILWTLGGASWSWWATIGLRVAYMHLSGQA